MRLTTLTKDCPLLVEGSHCKIYKMSEYINMKSISNTHSQLMRQVIQKMGLFVTQQDFVCCLTSHTDASLHSALKHGCHRF